MQLKSHSLDLKIAIAVFILASSIYLIFMRGNMTSDGYFYFLSAESIIRDHDLSIEPELPYGNPVDIRAPLGRGGKKYLYNHFGWAILLLPLTSLGVSIAKFFPYKTVPMAIASTTNCFITALTCVMLYLFSRRLKYPPHTSTILSLLYGFTTIAFSYATTSFCEPANTFMIVASIFFLYRYTQEKSYLALTFSGFLLGYACLIRIWNLFLLPAFLLYIFHYLKQSGVRKPFKFLQSISVFLIPVLCMVIFNESYFYATRGSSYLFGEGSNDPEGKNAFSEFMPFSTLMKGLYGLLFSSGKGVFSYNPILLFSIFLFRNFYFRYRAEALLFAYIFISHLFFIGSISSWSGDLAWGPRYLLPAIPFLVLFLGVQKEKKFWLKLLLICALGGILVQLPSILVDTDVYTLGAVGKGHEIEEIYFRVPLSPIIGTWKMLVKEILSFSRDKSNGLSPFFFRLFDRELYTNGGEIITISGKFTIVVSSLITGLISIAVITTYRIIWLLQQIKSIRSLS